VEAGGMSAAALSPFWIIAALAAVSFACRIGGFALMRALPKSPRFEAAIRATPLAAIMGIVAPVAASGRLPELLALGAIVIGMRFIRNDVFAALVGVAVVAVARAVL
jgi:uncharacterized membrane protein